MLATYVRRELANRRKQTFIIAAGMALAIALVIIVSGVSAGVKNAQSSVLQSVYGVGTDITVSAPASAQPASPQQGQGGGPRFDFGAGAGTSTSAGQQLATSRLTVSRSSTPIDAAAVTAAAKTKNVAAAAGVLSLTNTSFSGTLPNFQQRGTGSSPTPSGGSDGAGGSSFTVDSFTVLGLDPSGMSVGPLSSATLTSGRSFSSSDVGKDVAVLDASYAKSASKALGGSLDIGGTSFTVIGIVSATGSDSSTASNVYIPLDVAQTLSSETGKVTSVYVKAASSSAISQIKADLNTALPGTTVSTQADLASSVSGSLGTAGDLIANLGTWLSVAVLAAAFCIAILFTLSGVTRRTREFGTLKAIGWSNRSIVRQVAGESVVQGLMGGVIGVAVGLLGILVVNAVSPSLSGTVSTGASVAGSGGTGPAAGGGFGAAAQAAAKAATSTVALQAPVTGWVIVAAVGLAVIGGLLAGAVGGWRAAHLRPAAAFRSVA
jgi:putative ABC transport system permease protein